MLSERPPVVERIVAGADDALAIAISCEGRAHPGRLSRQEIDALVTGCKNSADLRVKPAPAIDLVLARRLAAERSCYPR